MIQVRLLGGVVVLRDGGLLTGRAAQRHPLAMLAFLAVAPGRTATRDKLIAHLWPDSDGPRARHRLSVALHVLRRGLGDGCLATAGDSVTLGRHVWTDVGAFLDAIAGGRLEDAVTTYEGPFLDRFFVGNVKDTSVG